MYDKKPFKPTREFLMKIGHMQLRWLIDGTDIEFDATPFEVYLALFDLNRIFQTSKYTTLYDFVNLLPVVDDGLCLSFDPRNEDLMKGWAEECFDFDDYKLIDMEDGVPEILEDDNGDPLYLITFSKKPCDKLYSCDLNCEECAAERKIFLTHNGT